MEYLALYRKYRPATFSEVFGQPSVIKALRSQITGGRIAHAYLFCGPRGTGKTTVARILAKAINCHDLQDGEPCGKCPSCLDAEGTSMDIIEIDAASNNQVDKVREMIENVHYMPAVGIKRVYIIDEVHMLSAAAFNALLKTLEEPPEHVVFVLATTEPHKLLPTVLSRCQRYDFRRIADNDVYARLEEVAREEGIAIEEEALKAITAFSEGGLRDALSLLDQCVSLSSSGRVTAEMLYETLGTANTDFYRKMCGYLLTGDAASALTALEGFISRGGDLRIFVQDLCRSFRDLYAETGDASAVSGATPGNILYCLRTMAETESKLRYSTNQRVLTELGLFQCAHAEEMRDQEALLARIERLEEQVRQLAARPMAAAAPAPAPAPAPVMMEEDFFVPPEAPPPEDAPVAFFAPVFDAPAPQRGIKAEPKAKSEPAAPKSSPAPKAAPKPEPKAEESSAAPVGELNAAAIWDKVCSLAGVRLRIDLAQGKGIAVEGSTLRVAFPEDKGTAVESLQMERRKKEVAELIEKASGQKLVLKAELSSYTDAQKNLMEESLKYIPKDITTIIN